MEAREVTALLAFAESARDAILVVGRAVEKLAERFDAELAEIRDGMIELDHKIAAVAAGRWAKDGMTDAERRRALGIDP